MPGEFMPPAEPTPPDVPQPENDQQPPFNWVRQFPGMTAAKAAALIQRQYD